jgi:hypothetical protein
MSLPLKTLSLDALHLYPSKNPSTGITEPLRGVLGLVPPKIKWAVFAENSPSLFLSGVKEVKGGSPEGIGAKRRPLTSEGRQSLVWFCQWVRFVSTKRVGGRG